MAKLRVNEITAPIVKEEYTGSVFFDGNGDHLNVSSSSDFQFGAGEFSIEAWVYLVEAKDQAIFGTNNSASPNYEGYELDVFTNGSVRFYSGNGSAYNYGALGLESPAGVVPQQTWTHLAISREGNSLRLFVNGVLSALNTSFSHAIEDSAVAPDIGNDGRSTGTSYHTHGYISNLRVCKGHAVYTGNFTVPTRELEVHEGPDHDRTVLLACQDAYNPTTEATGRHTITGAGNLGGVSGQELVENGDFASSLDNWTASGVQFSHTTNNVGGNTSGKLMYYATGSNTSRNIYQDVPTVSGARYILSFDSSSDTASANTIDIDGTTVYTLEDNNNASLIRTEVEFTASSSTTRIRFISTVSNRAYLDNVSVVAVPPISEANPGLLRKTNTTSTITETTGSVYFDGDGDYFDISKAPFQFLHKLTHAWTVECWFYKTSDAQGTLFDTGGSSGSAIGTAVYINSGGDVRLRIRQALSATVVSENNVGAVSLHTWHHFALTFDGQVIRTFIDGAIISTVNYNAQSSTDSTQTLKIGVYEFSGTSKSGYYQGYISNFRICKGHAVYTSNFIPPTRELEVHPGPDDDRTVLLCCYDGENIFAEKTGDHIIAAYGDRTSSPTPTAAYSPVGSTTVTPGLTREVNPTAGPTFQGGAGFVSQNWLTLPKGTTAERNPKLSNAVSHGSARAIFGAIQVYPTAGDSIHYATIATFGNTVDFGDLVVAKRYAAGCASKTRGLFGGGSDTAPSPNNTQDSISYITIATTGNSLDFGDLTEARWSPSAFSNATRGIWFSGNTSPANTEVIDYVTISTLGDALDFGDAFSSRRYPLGSTSDTTRGIDAGGHPASDNVIQYVTFASKGDSLDFGDLMQGVDAGCGGVSNGTRGVFAGGYNPTQINTIQYITIQSMGNSKDFGDMTSTDARHGAAAESSTRGLFTHGGYPSRLNTIDAITIATTGNAVEFGDIIDIGGNDGGGDSGTQSGFSNGHGGLG